MVKLKKRCLGELRQNMPWTFLEILGIQEDSAKTRASEIICSCCQFSSPDSYGLKNQKLQDRKLNSIALYNL